MYRRTRKYVARRKWHPRQEVALEDQRTPHWQPPALRRRIVIEDFDDAEPCVHVIELHRTSRIDSYRAVIDGREWNPRVFPYNPKSIGTAFTTACKVLGIKNLHFHDLRHEATSRLFERGYSIQEVAQFTLHESWATLRRYTHLKPENVEER